jgi:hypothetical protein
MIQLTDKQKEILLKLGGTPSLEMIPSDIWNQLLVLGLIYKRPDGKFDLTESGERTYNRLAKRHHNK